MDWIAVPSTLTHVAPRHSSDINDWELRRNTALAVREYVPGNLIYANGHKFVPRHFYLVPAEPLLFRIDLANESVQESGKSQPNASVAAMGSLPLAAVAICDVEAPHQSYISDEEDYRFQMPVAVFAEDQGRHSGGSAYEWGQAALLLKRGLHIRLINIGPASTVQTQMGYPLCRVCGASRSPLTSQTELERFQQIHAERCGQPIQNMGFYAEIIADALVLPDCKSREIAYSVMEALRQGAANILDMEISDLQVQVIGKPAGEVVDALLYDPMPGGSGLLEQLLQHWPDVVQAARHLVENCPAACDTACVDCLQHFRNAFYHRRLNRHTAHTSFKEWGSVIRFTHAIPAVLPDSTQPPQPGNAPEQQLIALLNAAGLTTFTTEQPIPLSGAITTRPDVYFHNPNDQYEGVCVYLDGMSKHLHGNPRTAAQDRQIRDELRNTDYEVIEIYYQELFDKTAMREHIRRIAKAVVGKTKAKEITANDAWFEAVSAQTLLAPSTRQPITATILPFKTLTPQDRDFAPYRNCVPLTTLKAAAGAWSPEQSGFPKIADHAEEWVVITDSPIEPGMFVAQVMGESMEPQVPAGSYCLFRPVPAGTRHGRKLLVWHTGVMDEETGGHYTLKVYWSEKIMGDNGEWQHERITLKPLNPKYQPLVLEAESFGDVQVIAEWVRVI